MQASRAVPFLDGEQVLLVRLHRLASHLREARHDGYGLQPVEEDAQVDAVALDRARREGPRLEVPEVALDEQPQMRVAHRAASERVGHGRRLGPGEQLVEEAQPLAAAVHHRDVLELDELAQVGARLVVAPADRLPRLAPTEAGLAHTTQLLEQPPRRDAQLVEGGAEDDRRQLAHDRHVRLVDLDVGDLLARGDEVLDLLLPLPQVRDRAQQPEELLLVAPGPQPPLGPHQRRRQRVDDLESSRSSRCAAWCRGDDRLALQPRGESVERLGLPLPLRGCAGSARRIRRRRARGSGSASPPRAGAPSS